MPNILFVLKLADLSIIAHPYHDFIKVVQKDDETFIYFKDYDEDDPEPFCYPVDGNAIDTIGLITHSMSFERKTVEIKIKSK